MYKRRPRKGSHIFLCCKAQLGRNIYLTSIVHNLEVYPLLYVPIETILYPGYHTWSYNGVEILKECAAIKKIMLQKSVFLFLKKKKMLRRKPTSVTLTTMDIELFKDIVREQQLKKYEENQVHSPESDVDRDTIFMGRSISQMSSKLDLYKRLGLKEKEEEEDEDIEGPLFKKTRF
ncbi:hypothetical protein BDF21DRAFT_406223 [Thamnidium elegans]|nr:hypothetical protein BDF21DRAFT_406223 [Thamnidium elegans]